MTRMKNCVAQVKLRRFKISLGGVKSYRPFAASLKQFAGGDLFDQSAIGVEKI